MFCFWMCPTVMITPSLPPPTPLTEPWNPHHLRDLAFLSQQWPHPSTSRQFMRKTSRWVERFISNWTERRKKGCQKKRQLFERFSVVSSAFLDSGCPVGEFILKQDPEPGLMTASSCHIHNPWCQALSLIYCQSLSPIWSSLCPSEMGNAYGD